MVQKKQIPYVRTLNDLPQGNDFYIVNTGYDSKVEEEKLLIEKGIKIIQRPCPYVRKIRILLKKADPIYQYVLLCESNHIIIKNFATIFPSDLILVQMSNYKERILLQANEKPIKFISYVTFLKKHSEEIFQFINENFPGKDHVKIDTQCIWADGKQSPITEINKINIEEITSINNTCLISTKGSKIGHLTLL
ncbi:MAG: hypothetical protein LUD02_11170 [Tannerellaceae bacterium]|nr:hypothetical protein [Tannerellaceae bacterium]